MYNIMLLKRIQINVFIHLSVSDLDFFYCLDTGALPGYVSKGEYEVKISVINKWSVTLLQSKAAYSLEWFIN